MNTYQEDKHSMHLTSVTYLDNNAAEAAQLPAFTEKKDKLDLNLTATGLIIKKLMVDTSGIGMDKGTLQDLAIGHGLDLSRKMVAFAKVTKNIELEKKVKMTSALKNLADTVLKEKLEGVHDLGVEYMAEAATYGVNEALLAGVQKAINSYFASIPKPRLSITEKKELNMELKKLQKGSDELFDIIDALVDTVKETSPVFRQGYFNARRMVNTGVRHLSMKIQVNNAGSGVGERGVDVELAEQAGGVKEAGLELTKTAKRTGAMGGVIVKGLNDGAYLVTVSKAGFMPKSVTAYVTQGELTNVVIELVNN